MNVYVRFAFLSSIFVCLLSALVIEIGIIAEITRENKKRDRKKNQSPEEARTPGQIEKF